MRRPCLLTKPGKPLDWDLVKIATARQVPDGWFWKICQRKKGYRNSGIKYRIKEIRNLRNNIYAVIYKNGTLYVLRARKKKLESGAVNQTLGWRITLLII